MVLNQVSRCFRELVVLLSYLRNEVESNHVSGLGSDRVGGKLELVVGRNRDHHSSSRSSHCLEKTGSENCGEKHLVD